MEMSNKIPGIFWSSNNKTFSFKKLAKITLNSSLGKKTKKQGIRVRKKIPKLHNFLLPVFMNPGCSAMFELFNSFTAFR